MRDGLLRAEIGAAHVDLVHQVEAFHWRFEGAGEADRRGVVDQDVDAAEALDGRGDGCLDLRLVADIGGDREASTAGSLNIGGRGMDCPRQLRMRFGGLRRDDDVCAVGCGTYRDCVADAPGSAGDEYGSTVQGHRPQITRITRMREAPRQALRAWQCVETRDRKSVAARGLSILGFGTLPSAGQSPAPRLPDACHAELRSLPCNP